MARYLTKLTHSNSIVSKNRGKIGNIRENLIGVLQQYNEKNSTKKEYQNV